MVIIFGSDLNKQNPRSLMREKKEERERGSGERTRGERRRELEEGTRERIGFEFDQIQSPLFFCWNCFALWFFFSKQKEILTLAFYIDEFGSGVFCCDDCTFLFIGEATERETKIEGKKKRKFQSPPILNVCFQVWKNEWNNDKCFLVVVLPIWQPICSLFSFVPIISCFTVSFFASYIFFHLKILWSPLLRHEKWGF